MQSREMRIVTALLSPEHGPLGVTVDPFSFTQNTFFGSTNVSRPMHSRYSLNCLNIPTEKKSV